MGTWMVFFPTGNYIIPANDESRIGELNGKGHMTDLEGK